MTRLPLRLLVVGLLSPGSVIAQEYISPSELANAFVGHCLLNPGRTDKIRAAAQSFDYSELSGADALMLGPQDPSAEFQAWSVGDSPSELYFLAVSEAEIDGVSMSTCTVSNPYTGAQETLAALQELQTIGNAAYEEVQAGQRYRIWETESLASGSYIAIIDALKLGISGGTYSFVAKTEK